MGCSKTLPRRRRYQHTGVVWNLTFSNSHIRMLLYIRQPSGPCGDTGHLGHYKNNWTELSERYRPITITKTIVFKHTKWDATSGRGYLLGGSCPGKVPVLLLCYSVEPIHGKKGNGKFPLPFLPVAYFYIAVFSWPKFPLPFSPLPYLPFTVEPVGCNFSKSCLMFFFLYRSFVC